MRKPKKIWCSYSIVKGKVVENADCGRDSKVLLQVIPPPYGVLVCGFLESSRSVRAQKHRCVELELNLDAHTFLESLTE